MSPNLEAAEIVGEYYRTEDGGVVEPSVDRTKLIKVPPPATQDQDRVTAKIQVVHQGCCSEAEGVDLVFDDLLKTREQVFRRRLMVGEKWVPLELGWLKEAAGFIAISNHASLNLRVQMSDEQREELDKMVLQFKHKDAPEVSARKIRPGKFDFGEFVRPGEHELRSMSGEIEVHILVTPK